MPRCEIDVDACPGFGRLVKQLRKKYRRIDADLVDIFQKIEQDYETVAGADPIAGWGRTVWKHRCGSRDMNVGRRGGFRIISFVRTDQEPHVLYPILIYAKADKADVSVIEISEAVKSLERELKELQQGLEPGQDTHPEVQD